MFRRYIYYKVGGADQTNKLKESTMSATNIQKPYKNIIDLIQENWTLGTFGQHVSGHMQSTSLHNEALEKITEAANNLKNAVADKATNEEIIDFETALTSITKAVNTFISSDKKGEVAFFRETIAAAAAGLKAKTRNFGKYRYQ